ncbi:MAG TPA: hypothetical protein VHC69_18335 [Polyangiaceae bacterium]|nr:hypothetical protein [Polyangiaceae bacterium]
MALGRIALNGVAGAILTVACASDKGNIVAEEAGVDGSTSGTGGKVGAGGSSSGGKTGSGGATTGSGGSTAGSGGKGLPDAGVPDSDGGGPSAPSLCGGMTGDDLVTCGQYIVQNIDACGDCHTPRLSNGAPDTTKLLAGSPSFTDLTADPNDGVGNIPAPNLTTLKQDGWTSAEIIDAIQSGKVSKAHGGKALFPAMPYVTFHNMAAIDAQAIAAFLSSLTPISNDIPAREPLPNGLDTMLPVPPVNPGDIPDPMLDPSDPSYADAMFGKYLAAEVGPCLDCHTERLPDLTVDMAHPFGGGQRFELGNPFGTVISANLTTDPKTGLQNWTPGLIQKLLQTGVNNEGETICPPMPVGPMGAFAGITNAHALAIGAYITHLPPVSTGGDGGGPFPLCVLPKAPDGGSTDGGKTDAGP